MRTAICVIFLLVIAITSYGQIIKTQIKMTVRDELGNVVEDANVRLFENEADYKAEKNPAAEAFTDAKGVVRFKDLKAIAYYIIAKKEDKDNAGGAELTEKLVAKRINEVTVIIQ